MASSKNATQALGLEPKEETPDTVTKLSVSDPSTQQVDIFTPVDDDGRKAITMEDAIAWMNKHYVEEDDSDAAIERISLDILNAETADEVLSTGQTTKAEAVFNIPLLVTDVKYQVSDEEYQEDSIGWYVILYVRRSDTREDDVVSTGARSVVLQAVRLHMLGAFPRVVKIQQSKRKSKRGRYPIRMTLPV